LTKNTQKPDTAAALRVLKDFQLKTVDHVFGKLYDEGAKRFLIADEVGLGKTLIARGLIARAIDRLWDGPARAERIDVIYVCSNADIARQNVNRLGMATAGAACSRHQPHATRLTLLPLHLDDLNDSRINFVSFTPGTSFDLRSSGGIAHERVLIYWLLREGWGFGGAAGPMNVFQYTVMDKDRWRDRYLKSIEVDCINQDLAGRFIKALALKPRLRSDFDDLCDRFAWYRKYVPEEDAALQRGFIGAVRQVLAETCCHALEPDIVILDEFQRFKDLLDGQDEAAELARTLFEYEAAKVVLLSATPYKPYTLYQEAGTDDHYRDFLRTTSFLFGPGTRTKTLEQALRDYREGLLLGGHAGTGRLAEARQRIESTLREVMVRTERLASTCDRNGMLEERRDSQVTVEADDIREFAMIDAVAQHLEVTEPVEYWKSAPYLLNMMDRTGYRLKERLLEVLDDQPPVLVEDLQRRSEYLLPWEKVSAYEALEPRNARLRRLMADSLGAGQWKLLWIPPSLPYYRPQAGPYAEAAGTPFSKHLVFSSWRVVPKVIAMLCSYDAERRMVAGPDVRLGYAGHAQSRARLLEFPVIDGRPDRMANLVPFYPCWTLASCCDPLLPGVRECKDNGDASYRRVAAVVRKQVEELLRPVLRAHARPGRVDQSWYWAALSLMDMHHSRRAAAAWLGTGDEELRWSRMLESRGGAGEGQFAAHVALFEACARGEVALHRPPDDLPDVLTKVAIASPGVTALRAMLRLHGTAECEQHPAHLMAAPARVALAFRSLFNLPANISLLQQLHASEELRYWEAVLDYCAQGNLQAVMDEYVHVLRESLGLLDKPAKESAAQLAEEIGAAVAIRTVNLDFDEVLAAPQKKQLRLATHSMRCRFALRFGDVRSQDERGEAGERTRKEEVRQAFNSPFWPFILATTSIGQEGLDFHQYCMNVWHWNLPGNPVDLEQREGRVHRYKGHAIRKSLADRYGLASLGSGLAPLCEPWSQLFARARKEFAQRGYNELVPSWVIPGASHKITRHVPMYPLSQERERYEHLKQAVASYRLVFGQPRQEDLLAYIHAHWRASGQEADLLANRIDLSPP